MLTGLGAYRSVELKLAYEICESHHLRKAPNVGRDVGDANQGISIQTRCLQSMQIFFKKIQSVRQRMQTLQERKELLEDTELDWVQEDYQKKKGLWFSSTIFVPTLAL